MTEIENITSALIQRHRNTPRKRIAVTGGIHTGKTTILRRIADHLFKSGIEVSGFVEHALFEGKTRSGYELIDIKSGETCRIADKNPHGHGYDFKNEAWTWSAERFNKPAEVLVVDELGLLEAEGRGFMPYLLKAIEKNTFHLIAGVRMDVLEITEQKLGRFDIILYADSSKFKSHHV